MKYFTHMRAGVSGATLLIVLVMLVVLTLFGISMIRLSSTNLRIVGNMQARALVEASAQRAIDQTISSIASFNSPSASVTVTQPAGMTVTVAPRVCLGAETAYGYSAAVALSPEDTVWEVTATVSDSITGANTVYRQGVKIRMLAGNCPS